MKQFHLTVHQYRQRLNEEAIVKYGWADPEEIEPKVKRYAIARKDYKLRIKAGEDFDPFTEDPNCKNCGKKKKKQTENNLETETIETIQPLEPFWLRTVNNVKSFFTKYKKQPQLTQNI